MINSEKKLATGTDLTLVLLHGWGMNQGVWREFKQLLETQTGLPVLCLDLPGFGNNIDANLATYTPQTIAEYLLPMLPNDCILVGWSMGGIVAQHLASLDLPNVHAHIQICSTPKFAEAENWPGIGQKVLNAFHSQVTQGHEAMLKRFLAIQFMGTDNAKLSITNTLAMILEYPLSNVVDLERGLTLLAEADLRVVSQKKRNRSCLRIFGRLDSLVPYSVIPRIESLFPEDKIVMINKASHAPFISHPEETQSIISTFLDSLDFNRN